MARWAYGRAQELADASWVEEAVDLVEAVLRWCEQIRRESQVWRAHDKTMINELMHGTAHYSTTQSLVRSKRSIGLAFVVWLTIFQPKARSGSIKERKKITASV